RFDKLEEYYAATRSRLSKKAVSYYGRLVAIIRHPERTFNKVWCVGLSKTGTTSLHRYLHSAGMMGGHFHNPFTGDLMDLLDTRILDAVSDSSAAYFARIAGVTPNSNLIFTSRNFATWENSFVHHFSRELGGTVPDFNQMKRRFYSGDKFALGGNWFSMHQDIYFRFD